jgi:Cryptococcal mannosyltransferase 1
VVFLNDVFACAGDVARLLAHEGVHLACGLDFDRPRIAQMDRQVRKPAMVQACNSHTLTGLQSGAPSQYVEVCRDCAQLLWQAIR